MTGWLAGLVATLSTLFGAGDDDVSCLILGALDVRRATALVEADPSALQAVYASEELISQDARTIAGYADRGLVLSGLAMQRLSCRRHPTVDESAADARGVEVIVLDVVDRLGATHVGHGATYRALPRDEPTRRRVTLVRGTDGWRIAAVGQSSATAAVRAE